MNFSQFCACLSGQPALLQRRVDACAGLGRSYEFSSCQMPQGCCPGQVGLGFWRDGTDYLLYFRPAVSYSGGDPRLRRFFPREISSAFPAFSLWRTAFGRWAIPPPCPPPFRPSTNTSENGYWGRSGR